MLYTRIENMYLNNIAMVGTSDQPCWLAEACVFLLLLLVQTVAEL